MDARSQQALACAMEIDAQFDGGSIEIVDATPDGRVELAIPTDSAAAFRQWFCFRALGLKQRPRSFALVNAGDATYADAFVGYSVMASYDQRRWFRVPTTFDGQVLEFEHAPRAREVTYAYFAPYSLDRQERLLRRAVRSGLARVEVVGRSVQGRAMSVLVVGDEGRDDRRKIWVTARQHPGETMAEWYMEGLVERLLDEDDEVARKLRGEAVLYLAPNMNPDGGFLGNLRTNAAGVDLNRTWSDPDDEGGPEVAAVRRAMHATGVDLFLDIHGDERNPFCFLAGSEGNPGYTERLRYLENLFEQSLLEFNADFQDEYGYERDAPGAGDLRCASNYVGEAFDCLSFTVEMPFKDNINAPDEVSGWSPDRSMHLGASTLDSVAVCLDELR